MHYSQFWPFYSMSNHYLDKSVSPISRFIQTFINFTPFSHFSELCSNQSSLSNKFRTNLRLEPHVPFYVEKLYVQNSNKTIQQRLLFKSCPIQISFERFISAQSLPLDKVQLWHNHLCSFANSSWTQGIPVFWNYNWKLALKLPEESSIACPPLEAIPCFTQSWIPFSCWAPF